MVQDCQTYTGLSQEREENIVQITTVQDNNNPEENQLNPMGVLKHLRGIFFFYCFSENFRYSLVRGFFQEKNVIFEIVNGESSLLKLKF